MATNPFYRLAPFIQEYIYRERWEHLRPVQVQTIEAILDTPSHLLITSGTASGKTEAAMLPILTQLHENPSATISVIYIGPLKALINDQFERLEEMLDETGIPVQSWHGDVAQSKKSKFLKHAQGILQITPESLEAMLINRHTELGRLFGDLRFVVIDEVHAFINSDRGRQVICQLQRLARYQSTPARRIGLSATLGEPELAMQWLAGGTDQPVTLINDSNSERTIELGLEYFVLPAEDDADGVAQPDRPDDDLDVVTKSDDAADGSKELDILQSVDLYEHLYRMCQRVHKTLIFANKRGDTELLITNLRKLAEKRRTPDFYHVHHGNIAAPLREHAENIMRDPERKACTAATITLELGIDIGHLDQVLQVDATHSVSSFVQRLGRSGRRDEPARMFFYNRGTDDTNQTVAESMPWNLLQTIAIIQLYRETKWVEPPCLPLYPFSLLYHQTMSTLAANTELAPPQLAEQLLTLSPFAHITQEHYRDLLHYLIEIQHLELMETGTLIIGLKAEKLVNNYRFYATFEDQVDFRVRSKSRDIGMIHAAPAVGDTIGLAGYTWRVIDINLDKRVIQVEPAKGKSKTFWLGGGIQIHSCILQRMRKILQEDTDYGFLQAQAQQQLKWARDLARNANLAYQQILPVAPDKYLILPWLGSRTATTQELLLKRAGLNIIESHTPFYYHIQGCNSIDKLKDQLTQIINAPPNPTQLIQNLPETSLEFNKYDRYIPQKLLQQAFVADIFDLEGAIDNLAEIANCN